MIPQVQVDYTYVVRINCISRSFKLVTLWRNFRIVEAES